MNGPAAHGPDGHRLRPATHGGRLPPRHVLLTLTRAERRAAVRVQLESHPEHSDRAIAKLCGVAPSTVGAVRSEVSGVQTEHLKRRGLDGKTYPTADPARRRLVEDHLRLHPAATISELRDLTGASTCSISTWRTVTLAKIAAEPALLRWGVAPARPGPWGASSARSCEARSGLASASLTGQIRSRFSGRALQAGKRLDAIAPFAQVVDGEFELVDTEVATGAESFPQPHRLGARFRPRQLGEAQELGAHRGVLVDAVGCDAPADQFLEPLAQNEGSGPQPWPAYVLPRLFEARGG